MKRNVFQQVKLLLVGLLIILSGTGFAQTFEVTTVGPGSPILGTSYGSTSASLATFDVINNNNSDVILRHLDAVIGSTTTNASIQIWYKPSPFVGSPGAISAANGWILADSGRANVTSVSAHQTQRVLSNLSGLIVPANDTISVAIYVDGAKYSNRDYADVNPLYKPTNNNVVINLSEVGGQGTRAYATSSAPPATPSNSPRAFLGTLHFENALPCIDPPTAGVAIASPFRACDTTVVIALSLSGNSTGMGQTYEWESSASNSPFVWTSMNVTTPTANVTQNAARWYRCKITCGTTTVYSTPVEVGFGTPLAGGTYTLNSGLPNTNTNFTSISALTYVLNGCGIAGPIVVNVAPNQLFNERMLLGNISGASATNTIRINGNGSTISNSGSSTALISTVEFDGTAYVTLNGFNILSTHPNNGFGILMTNASHHDSIINCTIDLSAVTNSSTNVTGGIILSGAKTTSSTVGNNAYDCYFKGNTIIGSTSNYGMYYGIYQNGSTAAQNINNIYEDNVIDNFYTYGIYIRYGTNVSLKNNEIKRATKSSVNGNSYGIYVQNVTAPLSVNNNKIHSLHGTNLNITNTSYPIYITSTSGTSATNFAQVSNNLVYNNSMPIYGIYISSSNFSQVFHNSIDIVSSPATSSSTEYGIYGTSVSSSEFKNNIVNINTLSTGQEYGIYLSSNILADGLQSNNVYINAPNSSNVAYYYGGNNYTTVQDFRVAYPTMETQALSENPYFRNAAIGDLYPLNNFLYRKGSDLGGRVIADINNGNRFVTNPTPGAYEILALSNSAMLDLDALVLDTGALCTPNQSIRVVLKNQGGTTITNAVIKWTIDNIAQANIVYTGSLAPLSSDTILLGNITLAPNVAYDILSHVVTVNNGNNTLPYSDTIARTLRLGLSGTYTINSNLLNSGFNFTTPQDFANALNSFGVCGPVVGNIAPNSGTYSGQLKFAKIAGTSAVNTITLQGNNNVITYNAISAMPHQLVIDNVNYLTIDQLEFKLSSNLGSGALITGVSSNIKLTNSVFDLSTSTSSSSSYYGIGLMGSYTSFTNAPHQNILIANNKILGTKTSMYGIYYGVYIASGGTDIIIRDNEIADVYLYGIFASQTNNLIVENNNIHRASKTSIASSTYYALYCSGTLRNAKIIRNKMHSPMGLANTSHGFYGIFINSQGTVTEPNLIANNLVYNINNNGVVFGIYSSASSYAKFLHNTVVIDKPMTNSGVNYGVYMTSTQSQTELKNNNIVITGGGTGNKYGYYINTTFSVANDGLQGNNVYINTTQSGAVYHSSYNGNRVTLAALRTAYPLMEITSVSADPMFMNASIGDYRLLNASTLYQTGENAQAVVPTDILGIPRAVMPTPGAYEIATPLVNDVAVLDMMEYACSGLSPVTTRIYNNGTSVLDSVRVNWSVNNVLQPALYYTTPIVTQAMSNTNFIHDVTLGNYNFNGPAVVKIWTSHPNGVADLNTFNDTLLSGTYIPRMGGQYTINANAPSSSTNFISFADFTSSLEVLGVCGPIVATVAPNSGPYVEQVTFKSYVGVSSANTITVKGNNNSIAFNASTSPANYEVLHLDGAQYINLDSLVLVTQNVNAGWGALINNGAAYDSITNCVFDLSAQISSNSTNSNGIVFSSSGTSPSSTGTNMARNIYIGNSTIQGNPNSMYSMYYAIIMNTGADSIVIKNNEIKDFYVYGINLNGVTLNTIIDGNWIHRSNKTSVNTFYGINTVSGNSFGTKIINNRIYSPSGISNNPSITFYGINSLADGSATEPILIANNAIYNINGGGNYGIYLNAALNTNVIHNTVSFDNPISYGVTSYGIYATGTNTGSTLQNNVISYKAGGTTTKYGYYISSTTSIIPANVQRNMVFMGSTQAGTQYYAYYGTNRANLAAFQAAHPTAEVGSISINPMFGNPNIGDLKPSLAAYQMLDNGLNLNTIAPTDILGVARPALPTPGAFQMDAVLQNNAAADTLVAPLKVCAGNSTVIASVKNTGSNNIVGVTVNWMVNGVLQTPVNYADTIYSPMLDTQNTSRAITLGSAPFITGNNTVKFWTSMPNNVVDTEVSNDTATVVVQSGMNGNYSIDNTSPATAVNFISIVDFANELKKRGVCGPVVATIATGTGPYTGQVEFDSLWGASPVNTVRLDGNDATLQANPQSTTDMRLVTLNGSQYLTIENLSIKTMNVNYGWGIHIFNGAAYDTIRNCTIDLSVVTNSSSNTSTGLAISASATSPISAAPSGTINAKNIYIADNVFDLGSATSPYGAYYGISIYGNAQGTGTDSVAFVNNEVKNFSYSGIYSNGNNNLRIENNNVHRSTKTALYTTLVGIYSSTDIGLRLVGNKIHDFAIRGIETTNQFYGIQLGSVNTPNNTTPAIIANNAIYNQYTYRGTSYGIYLSSGNNFRMIHNTVDFADTFATSSSSTMYGLYTSGSNSNSIIQNNLVTFTGGNNGTKYGNYVNTNASIQADGLQGNNIYFNTTATGTKYHTYYSGNRATLAALKTAYPAFELNSLEVNPRYFNASIGELSPTNDSLLGSGEDMTAIINYDIQNVSRLLGSTPGAFEEYKPIGTDAKLLAIIAPKGEVCLGVQDLKVVILNNGTTRLQNFDIHATYANATLPTFTYTSLLDTMGGAGSFIDTVVIGQVNVIGGVQNLTAWSDVVGDLNRYNDTLSATTTAQIVTLNANLDSVCYNNAIQLSLSGLPATTVIGWWSSLNDTTYAQVTGQSAINYTANNVLNSTYYTASYPITNGTCWTDTVKVEMVQPRFTVINDTSICESTSTTLTVQTTDATTVNWYASATSNTVIHTGHSFTTPVLNVNTTYFVQPAYQSTLSCTGVRDSIVVSIISKPAISLGLDRSICVNIGGADTLDAVLTGVSYLWDNNLTTRTRVINQTGTYSVMVTDGNGCMNADTVTVTFHNNPIINLGNDTSICADLSIGLNATTANAVSYLWNTSATTPLITTTNAGLYAVTVTDNKGCIGSDSLTLTHYAVPVVNLGADTTLCAAQTLDLNATVTGAVSYLWSTSAVTPIINVAGAGIFSVAATTINGCIGRDTIVVGYGNFPIRDIGNDTAICVGSSLTLNATTPFVATYQWSTAEVTPSIVVSTPGVYTVMATSTSGCFGYDTIVVTNNPLPVINLGSDTAICLGTNINIDATITNAAGYLWNTSAVTPIISASAAGIYVVIATDNNGCSSTDTLVISNYSLPVVDLGADLDTCIYPGFSQTLNASNSGASFLWDDASIGQTRTVNSSGTYHVTVTSPQGCINTDTIHINYKAIPIFALGNDTTVCAGTTLMLDATATNTPIASYVWNTSAVTAIINANLARTYAVRVTGTNGCSATDTMIVTHNPLPTANLGADLDTCVLPNYVHVLDAGNTGATYLWDDMSTGQTRNVTTSGTYSVTVTNGLGCVTQDVINISFRAKPVLGLGNDTAYCAGTVFMLDGRVANTNIASYLWNTTATTPTITASAAGTYSVRVVGTNGCVATDTINVNINANPIVNLGPDVDKCVDAGDVEFIDAQHPNAFYLWDNNYTGRVRAIDRSGTYYVRVTDANGCSGADTIRVTLRNSPVVSLGNDTSLCIGGSLLLNAGNDGIAYSWNTGQTSRTITTNIDGLFVVRVTGNNGCITTDSIRIAYSGNAPQHDGIRAVNQGAYTYKFDLTNAAYITNVDWDFGDGSPIVNGLNPTHIFPSLGNYIIRAFAYNDCGNVTATTTVHIVNTTGIDDVNKADFNVSLYPNPAKANIKVKTSVEEVKIEKLVLVDLSGKRILSQDVPRLSETALTLPDHIIDGMYMIEITTNKGIVYKKFNISR